MPKKKFNIPQDREDVNYEGGVNREVNQPVQKEQEQEKIRRRIRSNKEDCLRHIQDFYSTASRYRQQVYESAWNRYSRNYHSIYDPNRANEKAPWQSKMFVPTTVSNVEVVSSALAKVLLGQSNPIKIEPRETGDGLQAELMNKLLDYEMDKSNFRVGFYDALKQACIYGSGFMKFYWKKRYSKRKVKKPMMEDVYMAQINKRPPGVVGYREQEEEVVIEDNCAAEFIDIFDIFKEPKATKIEKVIHRGKISYGEMMDSIRFGFDEDAVRSLSNMEDESYIPQDKDEREADKGKVDINTPKTKYQRMHTIWEAWMPLPRKWIYPEIDPEEEGAEELVPAHAMVASGTALLFVEENEYETMEPPILQMDYIRTGDDYGKGICQLLEGIQEEINEIRNQRIDNVSLIMNRMVAVIEKALVSSGDLISKPGGVLRLKSTEDVSKAIAWMNVPDVSNSAYKETFELERQAQEVTAANRMTLGTAGMQRDANQTLGGMQLLMSSAQDRFTLYAYIIERMFIVHAGKWIYSLIYKNRDQESIQRILGEKPTMVSPDIPPVPRWMAFQWLPSHEIERDYDFKTVGSFSMGNTEKKALQLLQFAQTASQVLVGVDVRPILERVAQLQELDDEVPDILGQAMPVSPQTLEGMAGGPHGGQQSGEIPRPMQQGPQALGR